MRDLFFVGFLGALLTLGFRRPFLFVLAYAYIDIVSPQRLSYYLLNSVPISLIVFVLAVLGWLIADARQGVRLAPRQWLMILLLAYCGFTTLNADFPVDALGKWEWVWKALLFAIFLPMTLRTRLRIEALALFMVLSAATIIIVGGIKTVLSGGGYGALNLMVTNNSGLYESSTIACVAVAIVPLILFLSRNGTVFPPEWRVKLFALALAGACLLIPVGTEARTGLICVVVLGLIALRQTKRRVLWGAMAAGAVLIAIPFLPQSFTSRMDTITDYKADESASTRLAVWRWTLDYVGEKPLGGGFMAYMGNSFRYWTTERRVDDSGVVQAGSMVEDRSRAYHSAYFEMLGEQGWIGLVLWLLIHFGGLVRMEALYHRHRRRSDPADQWVAGLAWALSGAHLIYLVGALFVGIAFQPFVLMLVGMEIALDNYARDRLGDARKPFINQRAPATA